MRYIKNSLLTPCYIPECYLAVQIYNVNTEGTEIMTRDGVADLAVRYEWNMHDRTC